MDRGAASYIAGPFPPPPALRRWSQDLTTRGLFLNQDLLTKGLVTRVKLT